VKASNVAAGKRVRNRRYQPERGHFGGMSVDFGFKAALIPLICPTFKRHSNKNCFAGNAGAPAGQRLQNAQALLYFQPDQQ
jgi:hypothetical protein